MNYEIWHRELIDLLWTLEWELNKLEPEPPLTDWHKKGLTPAEAATKITNKWRKPPRGPGGGTRPSLRIYPRQTR